MNRLREIVERHQIPAFILLTFVWSWSYDGVVFLTVGDSPGILIRGIVRTWGPMIAAATVTWVIGGDLEAFFGQVTNWRVKPRWYVLTLLLPLTIEGSLAVSLLHLLRGGSVTLLPVPWWQYLLSFVVVLFFAGSLEEFGWRGFAQPRLQERYSALTAAIGIGVLWGLWHLPMFYLYDVPAYDPTGFWTTYLGFCIVASIYFVWLYNETGGSLLFPMISHSLANLPALVEPATSVSGPLQYVPELIAVILILGLVGLYGRQYLSSESPRPRIPGLSGEI